MQRLVTFCQHIIIGVDGELIDADGLPVLVLEQEAEHRLHTPELGG